MQPTKKPQEAASSPQSGLHTRRRTGKIARLPREHRDLINLMLRDGSSYSKIVQKLDELGHNLDKDNISRWYLGGYQDWIQEQTWVEEMRIRLDFAKDIVNQPNANLIDEASLRIAVTRMYNLLLSFDPLSLKAQLATQPIAYSRILGSLCKLTDALARSEHHRAETRSLFSDTEPMAAVQPTAPHKATPDV